MEYLAPLFASLFFIGIGFFVGKAPEGLAGYNTMPEWRKKWVDIKGAGKFMKKMLIITGIIIIPVYYILWFMGKQHAAGASLGFTPLVLMIYAIIRAQKFDRYKRK